MGEFMARNLTRATVVATTAVLLTLAAVPAALAHAAVELDQPHRGATNVTMTVTALAESESAGITSVRVLLPVPMTPDQISLASAPLGWTLTADVDSYTVAGPALRVHAQARHSVRVSRLPTDATVLVFRTIVTYGDGTTNAWIEEATPENPNPARPAPTVTLSAAASGGVIGSAWPVGAVLVVLLGVAAFMLVRRWRVRRVPAS
jgi:hypothetical protein